MDQKNEEKILNYIQSALNIYHGEGSLKWFFSFGTLLYFVRDRKLGIPMWGDYDIGVFADESDYTKIMLSMDSHGFELTNRIVDDTCGEPFQLVFNHRSSALSGMGVDVFFWRKYNGYYWHTYDFSMESPKNGIPSKYVFKGTSEEAFAGKFHWYTWLENIRKVPFPFKYGTLLDIWYPGWYIPDKRFGQSRADKQITLKTCKSLSEELK